MYRVAFLEAEHWHVLGHMAAIKTFDNVKVVAMSGNGDLYTFSEFIKRLHPLCWNV